MLIKLTAVKVVTFFYSANKKAIIFINCHIIFQKKERGAKNENDSEKYAHAYIYIFIYLRLFAEKRNLEKEFDTFQT